jgi:hypothetical protein
MAMAGYSLELVERCGCISTLRYTSREMVLLFASYGHFRIIPGTVISILLFLESPISDRKRKKNASSQETQTWALFREQRRDKGTWTMWKIG